jgi:hypothetical protein
MLRNPRGRCVPAFSAAWRCLVELFAARRLHEQRPTYGTEFGRSASRCTLQRDAEHHADSLLTRLKGWGLSEHETPALDSMPMRM